MMKLVEDFFEKVEELEINKEDIFCQEEKDYTVISFGEEGEAGIIYNLVLIFYKNEDVVEFFVRKQVKIKKLLDILMNLNSLNLEYRGFTFCAEEDLICLKSQCQSFGNIERILKQMVMCMQVASMEFPKFK